MDDNLKTELLHEAEVARKLKISVSWLRRQRSLGTGPTYIRVGGESGRAVRYRAHDVADWIENNRYPR